MTGEDVVRKVSERVGALRKTLADIEAEIARNTAAHREQAAGLERSMDEIRAEIAQRARRVIDPRPATSRRDNKSSPGGNPEARSAARAR